MAARPQNLDGSPNYYLWASQDITQPVVTVSGSIALLDNKRAPLPEHTSFGLKYREPINFQEYNYQMQGAPNWFQFFDEQLRIGDVVMTTRVSGGQETLSQFKIRMGGDWDLMTSEVVGPHTVEHYIKTA
jgi:hypothetical protein